MEKRITWDLMRSHLGTRQTFLSQGLSRSLFSRFFLLLILLGGVNTAWAADWVTFTPSSMTCGGLVITQASPEAEAPTYTTDNGLEFKVWSDNTVSFVTNSPYNNISNIELVFQTTDKNEITLNYGVYSDAECSNAVATGTFENASSNSAETTKSVNLSVSGYLKVYVTSSKGKSNAVSTTIKSIKITYSGTSIPSSACEMSNVYLKPKAGENILATLDGTTWTINVPYDCNEGTLTDGKYDAYMVYFEMSTGASGVETGNTTKAITSPIKKSLAIAANSKNSQRITVIAEDGTTQKDWIIQLVRGAAPTFTVTATSNITPELTGTGTQPHVNITDASSNVIESGSSVADGSTVTFTAVPDAGIVVNSIRNHYVFQKWDDETTTNPYVITVNGANVNRTAYFVRDHHTITYNANGGVGTTPDPIDYECGTYVTLANTEQVNLTKTGYTFWGWNINNVIYGTTKGNGVDKDRSGNNFNKDLTATANWIANTYTVTYNANGGSVDPTSQTYTYDGDPLEMPVPTKDDYTFKGWFTAAEGGNLVTEIGTSYKPTENITLYAHWEEGKVYLDVTTLTDGILPLTKANIDGQAYATATNNWRSQTKYSGYEGQFLDMSSNSRYIELNVEGANYFRVFVQTGSAGRKYEVKVDGASQGIIEHGGTGVEPSPIYGLTNTGSTIKLLGNSGTVYPVYIEFYNKIPTIITVKKNSAAVSRVSQYWDETVVYDVTSTSTEAISVTSDITEYANVTLADGKLTIAPKSTVPHGYAGKVTLTQEASGDFDSAETIIDVEFMWDTYTFTYSPKTIKIDLNKYTGDGAFGDFDVTKTPGGHDGVTIPAFPTLTVTKNGNDVSSTLVTDAFLKNLTYISDDHTLAIPGISGDDKVVNVKGGRQGVATITASWTPTHSVAGTVTAQYNIEVIDGFKTTLTNGDNVPNIQSTFTIKDASEKTLMDITLGGYKYGTNWTGDKNDAWSQNGNKVNDFGGQGKKQYHLKSIFVDGYGPQAQAVNDSKSEKGVEKRGLMEWFSTSDVKPNGEHYAEFERIHPFSLPCRGAYLKINPKVSGTATVYVLQNGNLEFINKTDNSIETKADANQSLPLGSGPRAYYWFDQDGWRIDPVDGVDPVAKQPLTIGRDHTSNVVDDDDQNKSVAQTAITEEVWNEAWTRFTSKDSGLKDYLTTVQPGRSNAYWLSESEIAANIALGDNMKPQDVIPYQKGWMVMQKCYVKYVINVIAGKTYYFFSNASKLGYAGVNFKPNAGIVSDGVTTITETKEALTLNQSEDDWTGSIASNKGKTIKSVTLSGRTFKANTWNTICLPFAVDEDQVQAIFGNGTLIPAEGGSIADKTKEVQLMVYNGYKNNTINFLRHVDQNILAGQPYLIRPAKEVTDPTFHNVTIPLDVAMVDYGSTDLYNSTSNNGYYVNTGNPSADPLQLIGTLAPTSVLSHDFYINASDGHIYEMSGSTSINAYRAFLQQKNRSNHAKVTSVGFALTDDPEANVGGDTDGIMQILVDGGFDVAPAEGVYSINGQKVSDSTIALPKGVYIVNGKKIVVK